MKLPFFPLAGLSLVAMACVGAEVPSLPKLTGVLALPGDERAMLEPMPGPGVSARNLILAPGQREADLELQAVEAATGTAQFRLHGSNAVVTLNSTPDDESTGVPTLNLVDARLDMVLQLYGESARRTVLTWPALVATTITCRANVTNRDDVANALATALQARGVVVIPDGDKFVMIVPKAVAGSVHPRSDGIKGAAAEDTTGQQKIAAGGIHFVGADVLQVMNVYAALAGRKLDLGGPWRHPATVVVLRNMTELTKEEALYALDVLLEWRRIKMVKTGDDLIRPEAMKSDQ